MGTKNRMDFKKVSLIMFSLYAVCIAVLLFNGVNREHFYGSKQLIYLILLWTLIISPQFILFQYVSNFEARWVQLISLILQVITFIFSLYYHGRVLLLMRTEDQPILTLFSLPIWEIVIVLAMGLIFKLIRSY